MSWLARVRRLTRNWIAHGFGPGGASPVPVIITGPCFTAALGDPAAVGVVADAATTAEMATDPAISLAFGEGAIAGVVGDVQIEGMAIDVC